MDDFSSFVSFNVYNPEDGVTWGALNLFLLKGQKNRELPEEVLPGKINVKLMTYYNDFKS